MTAEQEWMARFERETGKTIRGGELRLVHATEALLRFRVYATQYTGRQPVKLKVSPDVERQLLEEALSERLFIPPGDTLRCFGMVIEPDASLPPCSIVVAPEPTAPASPA